MGNRVMETPSLNGGTVRRQQLPKAVRLSRKRALKRALRNAADGQKPASPEVRRKRAPRVVAKVQEPVKSVKPVEQPRRVEQSPRVEQPKPTEQPQRVEQPQRTEQTQRIEKAPAVDRTKTLPIDQLEDGVVEWGIKRERE